MSASIQASADSFYFGTSEYRLFGAFHEAQTYAQREHGVVLCYPFGNEYIRSHRACRHLALRLAESGFPVLRFDYSGTGDSAGDAEDVDMNDWRRDIGHAVDELRRRTGVEAVCLAGLRLGGSLAYEAAMGHRDVDSLVLWEPIVNGRDYLSELSLQHQELLWRFFDEAWNPSISAAGEYLGFAVGPGLRDQLEAFDLRTLPIERSFSTLVVESQATPATSQLRDRSIQAGQDVDYELIPSFTVWREDIDKGLVPNDVIRGITAWAAEKLS